MNIDRERSEIKKMRREMLASGVSLEYRILMNRRNLREFNLINN